VPHDAFTVVRIVVGYVLGGARPVALCDRVLETYRSSSKFRIPDAAGRQTEPLQKGRKTVPFEGVIANGSTVYAVSHEETYAIAGRATRRLPPPTFAEHCGLTVAHLEGVMLIRHPRLAKQFHRDVIGFSRFAVPAL
jgi:hypothetical protein